MGWNLGELRFSQALNDEDVHRLLQTNGGEEQINVSGALIWSLVSLAIFISLCLASAFLCKNETVQNYRRRMLHPSTDLPRYFLTDSFVEEGRKEWQCVICLHMNHPKKSSCVMCGTPASVTLQVMQDDVGENDMHSGRYSKLPSQISFRHVPLIEESDEDDSSRQLKVSNTEDTSRYSSDSSNTDHNVEVVHSINIDPTSDLNDLEDETEQIAKKKRKKKKKKHSNDLEESLLDVETAEDQGPLILSPTNSMTDLEAAALLRSARLRSFHLRRVNKLTLNQRQRRAKRRMIWKRERLEDGQYRWVRTDVKPGEDELGILQEDSLAGSDLHSFHSCEGSRDRTRSLEEIVDGPGKEGFRRSLSVGGNLLAQGAQKNSDTDVPGPVFSGSGETSKDKGNGGRRSVLSRQASRGFVATRAANGKLLWVPTALAPSQRFANDDSHQFGEFDLEAVAALSFKLKSQWFFSQLDQLCAPWTEGHVVLTVRRDHMLEDSITLNNIPLFRWRQRLRVVFSNEPGLDAGGLMREWMLLLCKELFDETLGLFQRIHGDSLSYWINPASGRAVENHLEYFRFTGRLIGKALLEGQLLSVYLSLPLLKHILGVPITMSDLEFLDEDLYRSVRWMQNNSGVENLCLDFTVQQQYAPGDTKVMELKQGGEDIEVTDKNKHEYLNLLLRHKMLDSISEQVNELITGLREIIPEFLLAPFDYQELELLISGLPEIDVSDWKSHTDVVYKIPDMPSKKEESVLEWFWEEVEGYREEERAKLLQFVTGTSRVPIEGFKALMSNEGRIRRFTVHFVDLGPPPVGWFPKAHTCFNRIDLPTYKTKSDLSKYLSLVINMEITGFSME